MKPTKTTVRTYVTIFEDAAEKLEVDIGKSGQKQVMLLSRLVEWYVEQPEGFRKQIWNRGDATSELLKHRLGELAAVKAQDEKAMGSMSLEDATRLIRFLIEHVEQKYEQLAHELRERIKKK